MALSGHAVSVGSGADDVAGLDWTTGAVGDGERGGVGAMVTARGGVVDGGALDGAAGDGEALEVGEGLAAAPAVSLWETWTLTPGCEGGPPRARAPTATPPTARTTAARRARRGGFTDE